MTWFKVDDKLWGHPKWLATPPRARGLWVTAGSWSAGLGQDGNIPRHALPALGHSSRDAADLVASGLWSMTATGWEFHGWAEFQPDSASEKAKRDAASDGGALGNHTRWHVRRGIDVPSCGFCSGASGTDRGGESGANRPGANPPDPSRPDTRSAGVLRSVVDGETSSSSSPKVMRAAGDV